MALQRLEDLFKKYTDRQTTLSEEKELMDLIAAEANEPKVYELFEEAWLNLDPDNGPFKKSKSGIIFNKIETRIGLRQTRVIRLWPKIAVAVSILLMLSAGLYYGYYQTDRVEPIVLKKDIGPGSNKATLTLANGSQIALSSAGNGRLAIQANATINKTADGQIVYRSAVSPVSEIAFNTMSTPVGGQYHLTLADGTNVWLNAASSIKYPTSFPGRLRQVEITGEVYFEVAHQAEKPFRVLAKGQTVEVLGTHFNINAYDNELSVKTTLLEGSVRVEVLGNEKVLKPGQQASVRENSISLADVETDEVIAWKDGYFEFSNTPIQSAMRQISRWYDVEIQCTGQISNETLTGRISRFRNISQVLQMVQQSKKINITVNGRRIMVKD